MYSIIDVIVHEEYWKKIDAKILLQHPRLTVSEHRVVLPDGSEVEYLQYENTKDYVTVIAERNGSIAVLKEYSYPHDEWLWQFPEGSVEVNEDPDASASRELREEAGLAAEKVNLIGMNYGHHRRSAQKNYIFTATDVIEVAKSPGDKEEAGTTLHWFSLEELKRMVRIGDIRQKNTLAALALYLTCGDGEQA